MEMNGYDGCDFHIEWISESEEALSIWADFSLRSLPANYEPYLSLRAEQVIRTDRVLVASSQVWELDETELLVLAGSNYAMKFLY